MMFSSSALSLTHFLAVWEEINLCSPPSIQRLLSAVTPRHRDAARQALLQERLLHGRISPALKYLPLANAQASQLNSFFLSDLCKYCPHQDCRETIVRVRRALQRHSFDGAGCAMYPFSSCLFQSSNPIIRMRLDLAENPTLLCGKCEIYSELLFNTLHPVIIVDSRADIFNAPSHRSSGIQSKLKGIFYTKVSDKK